MNTSTRRFSGNNPLFDRAAVRRDYGGTRPIARIAALLASAVLSLALLGGVAVGLTNPTDASAQAGPIA